MKYGQRIEEEDPAFGRGSESYGLRSSVLLRLFYDSLVLPWSLLNGPLTFRVAGQVGRTLNRLKLSGPAPSSVRTLFGCDLAASGVIAGEMTANYFRNRAVIAFIRNQGLKRLSGLVEIEENPTSQELASQEQPVILLAWHVGALFGISGAAFQMGRPVLVFRKKPFYKPTPNFRVVTTQLRTDEERSLLLCESLKHLKAGGMVILAADGNTGGVVSAPCLGRSVDFRRGAFALSRLAGTPLIPTVSRWTPQGRMVVTFHPPLPACPAQADAPDAALAAAAARWYEAFLIRNPSELWPSGLYTFLHSPVLEPQDRR